MTDANVLINELRDLTAKFTRERREMIDGLKPKFHTMFKGLFEECPKLKEIFWTQYTPYFNDGDPCTFQTGEFCVNIHDVDEGEYEGNFEPRDIGDAVVYFETGKLPDRYPYNYPMAFATGYYKGKDPETEYKDELEGLNITRENIAEMGETAVKVQNALGALSSIPVEVLEEMFGDHVRVYINKDGVHTEEYDHD